MTTRFPLVLLFFALAIVPSLAQQPYLNEWRSHFNYNTGVKLAEVDHLIYNATTSGIFYYDKRDRSVRKFSKVDGFSEVEVSTIGYDAENRLLFIGFLNGNIDVLRNNRSIFNIPDIYRRNIIGRKDANNIRFHNNLAYITTAFGIVVYNISRNEIKETYTNIGSNGSVIEVFDVAFHEGSIYASTAQGVLKGSLEGSNLLNFMDWENINPARATAIASFDGKVYAVLNDKLWSFDGSTWETVQHVDQYFAITLEVLHGKLVLCHNQGASILDEQGQWDFVPEPGASHTIVDKDGFTWFANQIYGLVGKKGNDIIIVAPNGPGSNSAWHFDSHKGKMYVAGGSLGQNWGNTYNNSGFFVYENNTWASYSSANQPLMDINQVRDIIRVKVDPRTGTAYFGSFNQGLVEFKNGKVEEVYNQTNSSLGLWVDGISVRVSGIDFDDKNNLWVTSLGATNQLSVKKTDGQWLSFNAGTQKNVSYLVVDENGYKWMPVLDGGILVYDNGSTLENTQDDRSRHLSDIEGQGGLPSRHVSAIAVDLKGEIWVGTGDGIAVFHDPYNVFTSNVNASRIWIDDGYLLYGEVVTSITIDGGNRKWIGTRNGAWLTSADGTRIIHHFTTENSPLPSNHIVSIGINNENGEVFFATSEGMVSFRSTAIGGGNVHGNVYAFPNPVRENYEGPIAITGLVRNAVVKITDVTGNLVYETRAEGGQAIWNGRNFSGRKVNTGVYMVFSSDEDGIETYVTKLLFIR